MSEFPYYRVYQYKSGTLIKCSKNLSLERARAHATYLSTQRRYLKQTVIVEYSEKYKSSIIEVFTPKLKEK